MTNAQRRKLWLESGDNSGKNLVLVETNSGRACFFQLGFGEAFGAEACTGFLDMAFEDAFEMLTNDLPWGEFYHVRNPTRKQLDQLIKYYHK